MRVKLSLVRDDASIADVSVTADAGARILDVAGALAARDPLGEGARGAGGHTLALGHGGAWTTLDPQRPFEDSGLLSGSHVSLVAVPADAVRDREGAGRARFTVIGGADDGRTLTMTTPTTTIGRGDQNELVLTDPSISKSHATLELHPDGVLVTDLNSANGLVVDGGLVARTVLRPGWDVVLGDVTLRLVEVDAPLGDASERHPVEVLFNRSPRVEERYPGREFPSPEPPVEQDSQPFPWLIMIAPLLMGAVLFSITRSPLSIAFVALSPVLMLANWLTTRGTRKRRLRDQIRRFEEQMVSLRDKLTKEIVHERVARLKEAATTAEVVAAATTRRSPLWTRRPEHWSFLNVRLGTGTLPSRNSIAATPGMERALQEYVDRLDALAAEFADVPDVPVFENLHDAGALGVSGPPASVRDAAAALLVQLTGLHAPDELVVAAVVGPATATEFEWLRWLPHATSTASPLGAHPHLADSEPSARSLVTALEELIDSRAPEAKRDPFARAADSLDDAAVARAARVGDASDGAMPPAIAHPAIVLLISDDAPLERGRLVQLAERAADAGIYPVWLSRTAAGLPAVCRTFVELAEDGSAAARASFVRLGRVVVPLVPEVLPAPQHAVFARSVSPVVDSGGFRAETSDLPRSVALPALLDAELLDSPAAVIDRWAQNDSLLDRSGAPTAVRHKPGRLRAIVGQAATEAMHLDLRAQGPHALVGGTTGSGKSEFLQTWVLGMAAEYSPDRVTFLFVDYKGGSAFADCVRLPHCVGLVTDLSPHLVRRALTSLRAELQHREHLFNRKKAKDILEMESLRDPETPPALVIVIDEFAALVGEVPEFVDGVVDVAQRGRSLGIHLILATQRPAGVIRDNLRANTNLRIALRMADEADSVDVLGVPAAAGFDPAIPGRASAKTGPGRLMPFQAGYAGGWTTDEKPVAAVDVRELRFGSPVVWAEPDDGAPAAPEDPGPTDQARLVGSIDRAFDGARLPHPRRPWLPELAPAYDLARLPQRTDARLLLGVADVPTRQAQEPVYFLPDTDGHLAVYGTGGSGKSTLLRTLAVAAGITPRGGDVDVYGLDFGSGGLRMLEPLPHVGAVVPGDDSERVVRLFRRLSNEIDRRAALFAAAKVTTLAEFRETAAGAGERRILLLIDGFPAFRAEYEVGAGRAEWYAVLQQLLSDGRPFGIHVALTADRASSVPSSIGSNIPRRVILRLADETGYTLLDVDDDVLSSDSPPGRAIVDGTETQIAVLGGSSSTLDQARVIEELAETIAGRRPPAEPVRSLPREVALSTLPREVDGLPVLGLSDETLAPLGVEPTGALLLAGPPASGRTTALLALATSLHRTEPDAQLYFVGSKRSRLAGRDLWTDAALDLDATVALAKELAGRVPTEEPEAGGRIAVFVENISEFLSTPADAALVELIKAIKRSDHFLVAESETASWGSSWPLLGEIKSARRGILLQPDPSDGDSILRTALPRVSRAEFPAGRGYLLRAGRALRVQLPLVD